MQQPEIRKEAIARQGSVIERHGRRYKIEGDQGRARFQMGAEGLVHTATEEGTKEKYRIKCFWEPDEDRLARSRFLVKQKLANTTEIPVDVLAGAPFDLIDTIGGASRFALIMKNVEGGSWKLFCQNAELSGQYPPPRWPTFSTRLVWAYGLVSAVERMESRGFVHADLSDGNVVLAPSGEYGGRIALVDFDAYFNPKHPSPYRGTENFVAPEIWDRGPTGIGSDRVAMSILIQDLLLTGDPEMNAAEAFSYKYTQDQICKYQGDAHPLLAKRHPQLAKLLENTLRARNREGRPTPQQWRQALREISASRAARLPSWKLDSIPANPAVQIAMNSVVVHDLSRTPFGIHANLSQLKDGSIHLRVQEGGQVRLKFAGEAWRALPVGQDLAISSNATFFDLRGKLQGQLTHDPESEQLTAVDTTSVLALFDSALQPPSSLPLRLRQTFSRFEGQQLLYFLIGFIGMLALLLAFIVAAVVLSR